MHNLFLKGMGCLAVFWAVLPLSAEMLVYTSKWEILSYEAQQFPQDAPSPWAYASVTSTNGTRQIDDNEILNVNTTGSNGQHRYRKSMTKFNRQGDGYIISLCMALVANETTLAYRGRSDAAFSMLITDAVGVTSGQTYCVGIDNVAIATASTTDGALRTNVLFSTIFSDYNARIQNVYMIKRDVAALEVYVNGQLLFRDTGFESTTGGPTSESIMEFGDRATSFDCNFALDYLRAGQFYIPPPRGTCIAIQ